MLMMSFSLTQIIQRNDAIIFQKCQNTLDFFAYNMAVTYFTAWPTVNEYSYTLSFLKLQNFYLEEWSMETHP